MFYKCFITVLVVSCSSLNTEYWILNTSKYSIFVRFQQPWNSWGLLLGLLHNSAVKQGNSANFHRKWWRNLLLARHHHDQKEFFAGNNSSLRKAKIGPCVYPFWLVSNMSRSNIPDPNGRVLFVGGNHHRTKHEPLHRGSPALPDRRHWFARRQRFASGFSQWGRG